MTTIHYAFAICVIGCCVSVFAFLAAILPLKFKIWFWDFLWWSVGLKIWEKSARNHSIWENTRRLAWMKLDHNGKKLENDIIREECKVRVWGKQWWEHHCHNAIYQCGMCEKHYRREVERYRSRKQII